MMIAAVATAQSADTEPPIFRTGVSLVTIDAKVTARDGRDIGGLNAHDFVVDYRPGVGIRLSPHFYNTMDEIDAIMRELDRVTRTKEYLPGK